MASAATEVRVHVFNVFSFGFVSYTISFLVANVLRFAKSCELVDLFTCVASLEASHNKECVTFLLPILELPALAYRISSNNSRGRLCIFLTQKGGNYSREAINHGTVII